VEITRRKILIATAVGVGGAGIATLAPRGVREIVPRLRAVATPDLPKAAVGPLPPEHRTTLLATAGALIGRSVPAGGEDAEPEPEALEPYRRMFEARSRSLRGYRELYGRFARSLEGRATAAGATAFATLPPWRRLEMVTDLCPPGRLARLRTGLTDPDRTRFRLYIVREILDLYSATGAWWALGFGPPPGIPRGLTGYTRPPEGLPETDTADGAP